MGVALDFTEGKSAEDWIGTLYEEFRARAEDKGIEVPDFPTLKSKNWVRLPILANGPNRTFLASFRDDPERSPLPTPSGKIEIFSDTIHSFGYDDCPGHPAWLPPSEWFGSANEKFPLHLVSPQPGDKLHSQFESALADVAGARPETLVMSPDNAAARGLSTGDLVRVFNARGSCRARLSVSDEIQSGVVALPTGAWFGDPGGNIDQDGNPNVLTRDVGTSRLGQGCSAHTALVEVSKLEE